MVTSKIVNSAINQARANYLRTRNFKEVQQLFEQRFRDRVPPTNMTIWKNVKECKTEGSSLNLNNDRLGRRRTERTQENINLQEKLIEYPKISARKNCSDIVRVHLHELLSAI